MILSDQFIERARKKNERKEKILSGFLKSTWKLAMESSKKIKPIMSLDCKNLKTNQQFF